jgi:hypothetical protein
MARVVWLAIGLGIAFFGLLYLSMSMGDPCEGRAGWRLLGHPDGRGVMLSPVVCPPPKPKAGWAP